MVQDQDNTSRKNRVVKDQSDCPFVMQLEIIHHAGQEHLKSRSPPVALLETQVVHWRHGRKGWWRILHVSALLSWKWLQTMESDILVYDILNYQKRYLAIAWNTISSFMFACKAWNAMWYYFTAIYIDYRVVFDSNLFLFFLGPTACQKRHPKRYPYWNDIVTALCPQKASLKSLYVPWCPQQAVRTWLALGKSPQCEPAIVNTDMWNFIYIFLT